MKKQTYTPPKTDILEMNYADPVCQAASAGLEDYELLTPPGFDMLGIGI